VKVETSYTAEYLAPKLAVSARKSSQLVASA